jgi:hypothetical protein
LVSDPPPASPDGVPVDGEDRPPLDNPEADPRPALADPPVGSDPVSHHVSVDEDDTCDIGGVACDWYCWMCDDLTQLDISLFLARPTATSVDINVYSPTEDVSFRWWCFFVFLSTKQCVCVGERS